MNIYGLIGFPLTHSFSENYFNDKFLKEGIKDTVYRLFPLKDISEFPDLIRNEPDLKGLSVTIPYKEKVLKYINNLDDTAEKVGAINNIKITRNKLNSIQLTGYNTDVYGFEMSIKPLLNEYHNKALILGTGGASKAVEYVMKKLNLQYLLVTRNIKKEKLKANHLTYEMLTKEIIESHLIIINTSPLGMFPATEACPDIPYDFITERHLAYDLIYKPAETLFLKKCKDKHAIIMNGLLMLHLQAEQSWKIWNTEF
jgi:shikimate dehydrogenase